MEYTSLAANALRYWLKKSGLTQAALAEKTGLAQNYISQIATGARIPSMEAVNLLSDAFGESFMHFLEAKDDRLPEIVFVERVKARPRAGTGGLEVDAEHDGLYSFHAEFIARKRGKPDDMKLFEVAGDSMRPTLADGDLIMVNLSDTDIRTGYIYLLRIGEELMVKRLETRPGGVLLIRSDNPDYEDIPVNKAEAGDDICIFGRMVWSCREY